MAGVATGKDGDSRRADWIIPLASELHDFALRYAAAWSNQDPVAFAAFYADNGSLAINDGKPSVGRDAIAQTAREFMQAFPDMLVRLVAARREGANVIFEWHWTGTNTGPGGTGNAVDLQGLRRMDARYRWQDPAIARAPRRRGVPAPAARRRRLAAPHPNDSCRGGVVRTGAATGLRPIRRQTGQITANQGVIRGASAWPDLKHGTISPLSACRAGGAGSVFLYASVGAIGTAVHFAVLFAMLPIAGAVLASTLGAVFGLIVNYQLARHLVFTRSRPRRGDFARFVTVAICGLAVNAAIISLLLGVLPIVLNQVVASAAVLLLGFTLNKHWTFNAQQS